MEVDLAVGGCGYMLGFGWVCFGLVVFAMVVVVVVLWVFGGCWVDLALLLGCVCFWLCFELILF